jgi:hypothetical protein
LVPKDLFEVETRATDGSLRILEYVRFESAEMLAYPEVETLIAVAIATNKTPLPASGRRQTIIRSISAKQRPRRKPTE